MKFMDHLNIISLTLTEHQANGKVVKSWITEPVCRAVGMEREFS